MRKRAKKKVLVLHREYVSNTKKKAKNTLIHEKNEFWLALYINTYKM